MLSDTRSQARSTIDRRKRPRLCAAVLGLSLLAGCESVAPDPPPQVSDGVLRSAAAIPPPAEPAPLLQPLRAAVEGSHRSHASSPLALARFRGRRVALLADEDARQLRMLALDSGEQLAASALDGTPGHVLVSSHGDIYLTLRDTSEVVAFAPTCSTTTEAPADCTPALVEQERIATPEEPIALGLAHAEATLLVSCGWGRALLGHPLNDSGRHFVAPLSREPRGFAIDESGEQAIVAHALGSRISQVSLHDGVVSQERALHWRDDVLDPPSGNALAQMPRHLVQGFSVALIGERAWLPMVTVYPGDALSDSAGYGGSVMNIEPFFPHEQVLIETALSEQAPSWLRLDSEVVGADSKRRSSGRPITAPSSPCLLPRAIAPTPSGESVLIACFDTGEVLELTTDRLPLGRAVQRRFVVGHGATALAIDADAEEAWVWSLLTRRLSVLSLAQPGSEPSRTIELTDDELHPHASGRLAFFTQRASDGRSCASCHIDGRDDGLVWSSPAGSLSTPVLAGRLADTAPYGWHGESPTLSEHIALTFKRLRAPQPDEATLAALADYIASMPDHRTRQPALDAQQKRGQALFRSSVTACSSCHRGAAWTDGTRRKVGDEMAFDTPSLKQLHGSAPYWHDGRYDTLQALLASTDGHMGHTRHLGEAEMSDLIAYLSTM